MAPYRLSQHILPSSATMVGVCLTTIGLVKILEERIGASRVDEYLAMNSIVFLVSAFLSYFSLRPRLSKTIQLRFERYADLIFLIGLAGMAFIAVLFAYELV